MSGVFAREQSPAEVVAAISASPAPLEWQQFDEADRTLGIAKLQLAGVYDDRQSGYFMLRTRIPGGRLDVDQLSTVANVVRDFSRRPEGETGPEQFAEIATRQDLQVHWVRFEHLPEIWRRYEAVGLSNERACGDTLRNAVDSAVRACGGVPGYVTGTGRPAPLARPALRRELLIRPAQGRNVTGVAALATASPATSTKSRPQRAAEAGRGAISVRPGPGRAGPARPCRVGACGPAGPAARRRGPAAARPWRGSAHTRSPAARAGG